MKRQAQRALAALSQELSGRVDIEPVLALRGAPSAAGTRSGLTASSSSRPAVSPPCCVPDAVRL
ncbi:hypothetical protein ACH4RA_26760 [Streptomyces smyrnaeus]|uniref:hypothetical protein n=1 Tax=Streptomyces smyrnaeus TaxID=1387713 RepID=UPI0037A9A245